MEVLLTINQFVAVVRCCCDLVILLANRLVGEMAERLLAVGLSNTTVYLITGVQEPEVLRQLYR